LPSLIVLKNQSPLAGGKTQSVYQHPDDSNLLIKVRNLDRLKQTYERRLGGRIGFKRRHGFYTTWHRELEHYFSVCLRLGYRPHFLLEYHGVADTDIGLGLIVNRVNDRAGNLAPTLAELVTKTGLTDDLRAKVEDLRRQMNELRISTNDISVSNIVYGWNERIGDHLVLIEGIGVNTFVPLANFSNYFNVRSNNRHFARTVRWLEKLGHRTPHQSQADQPEGRLSP
jgi:hypothetical protein